MRTCRRANAGSFPSPNYGLLSPISARNCSTPTAAPAILTWLPSTGRRVRIAVAENIAVFHGWAEAGIVGITGSSAHEPIVLGKDYASYPGHVAKAVEILLEAGVSGPYGLALGPQEYTGVVETTEHGGLVVFDHLRQILGGPIVWAPGVKGLVVISLRGGDFLFESGEDLCLGYSHHDAETVHLYLEESFSFRVATPEAAVTLTAGGQ